MKRKGERGDADDVSDTPYIAGMTRRPLTLAERSLAAAMFGTAIDLDRVTICLARWWWFQPRNALMAPDGDIWCHPRGSLYRPCYASASLAMQALFLHEMTHVWQAQRGGRWYLPLMRHPFCRYAYAIEPGKPFARYGIEQQAEIVADAFLLRTGEDRPDKPELEIYEALLPFVAPAEAGAAPGRAPCISRRGNRRERL